MKKNKKIILISISFLLLLGLGGFLFAINQHSLITKSNTKSSKQHNNKPKTDETDSYSIGINIFPQH